VAGAGCTATLSERTARRREGTNPSESGEGAEAACGGLLEAPADGRNALDVDLAASTLTCVRELWPRLRPGGVLFSLDGQLRATHEILGDTRFWRDEVGVEPPVVGGLEYEKLLALRRS